MTNELRGIEVYHNEKEQYGTFRYLDENNQWKEIGDKWKLPEVVQQVELTSEDVEARINQLKLFKQELFELYEKHNVSISHEDIGGAFILEEYDSDNIEWMEQGFEFTIDKLEE